MSSHLALSLSSLVEGGSKPRWKVPRLSEISYCLLELRTLEKSGKVITPSEGVYLLEIHRNKG